MKNAVRMLIVGCLTASPGFSQGTLGPHDPSIPREQSLRALAAAREAGDGSRVARLLADLDAARCRAARRVAPLAPPPRSAPAESTALDALLPKPTPPSAPGATPIPSSATPPASRTWGDILTPVLKPPAGGTPPPVRKP